MVIMCKPGNMSFLYIVTAKAVGVIKCKFKGFEIAIYKVTS